MYELSDWYVSMKTSNVAYLAINSWMIPDEDIYGNHTDPAKIIIWTVFDIYIN